MPDAGTVKDESHGQTGSTKLNAQDIEKLEAKYLPGRPFLPPTHSLLPGMSTAPIGIQSRLAQIFPGGTTVVSVPKVGFSANSKIGGAGQKLLHAFGVSLE
jgi:hypothetical protein